MAEAPTSPKNTGSKFFLKAKKRSPGTPSGLSFVPMIFFFSDFVNFFFPQKMTFQKFTSKIIRVPRKDVDTDIIIPAKFLRVTDKAGLAEGCFFELKKDPNFPMNRPEFSGARVVVAGANFGCGSSREHAPWALKQSGIDAVISSEFADIFRGNAEKNGLLPIVLPEKVVEKILHFPDELAEISVDLKNQIVEFDGEKYHFKISTFAKKRLLKNLSDADFLSEFLPEISKFAENRKKKIPKIEK